MPNARRNYYTVLTGPSTSDAVLNHSWQGQRGFQEVKYGPFKHPLHDELVAANYRAWEIGTGFQADQLQHYIVLDYDVRKRDRPKSLLDFEDCSQYWFLSQRAYELVNRMAGDAIDVRSAKVTVRRDGLESQLPDYWAVDIVRYIDAIDYDATPPLWFKRGDVVMHDMAGAPFAFKRLSDGAHLFRIPRLLATVVCSEQFKAAAEAARLTGIEFMYMGSSGGEHGDGR